jgi:hypothetical protein
MCARSLNAGRLACPIDPLAVAGEAGRCLRPPRALPGQAWMTSSQDFKVVFGYLVSSSDAVGLAFLRYGGASPPAQTRSSKTHVAHRRIKIERVYRPYLTATEADLVYIQTTSRQASNIIPALHSSQAYKSSTAVGIRYLRNYSTAHNMVV